jgi:hypothetical protein
MVFLQFLSDEYMDVIQKAERKKCGITRIEQEDLDTTHFQIGEIVCDNWNLPENIKQCVKYCGDPGLAAEAGVKADILEMIKITSLGSLAAEIFFGWDRAGSISRFKEQFEKLNLGQEDAAEDFLKEVPQMLKDAGAVFLFKVDPNLSYESIAGNQDTSSGPAEIKLVK